MKAGFFIFRDRQSCSLLHLCQEREKPIFEEDDDPAGASKTPPLRRHSPNQKIQRTVPRASL